MKRWKPLTAALCAAVLLCGFSAVPAFAYADGGEGENYGDPIQYANLNTSYWQSHFYAYGRLP